MHPSLSNYIKRYVEITNEELAIFQKYLNPISLKKKDFLLQPGKVCQSRYFIIEGCIRLYYINDKGNEQIIHFGVDQWWMTDYESLIHQKPSKLFVQAIEDTTLLELKETNFQKLRQELPKSDQLFRMVMERAFVAMQRRIEFMFNLSGENMYKVFVEHNPEFAQRVPQYMIASYLGMTPEFVSKIRGKKD